MTIIMYLASIACDAGGRTMRVTREQAEQSRERIVEGASRLFRENGLDGIGVADLMKDAGLTHGGFYAHFASKEALMAEACARALEGSVAKWQRLSERNPGRALPAIVKSYLSTRHRDEPGAGCAIASLGNDVARQGPAVRHAFTEGLRNMVGMLAGMVPGRTAAVRRRQALADYSAMVGAMVLARAVDDPKLSEEILQSVSATITARA
jgi:TetR/AcrR family transcriptional repressor of nem operon